LRFRMGHRQRVRYLGCDEQQAARVQLELDALQQGRYLDRQLRELTQQAGRQLRESKRRLQPLIEVQGFKFHGRAIRQARRRADRSQ
jgi:hypothetical protein